MIGNGLECNYQYLVKIEKGLVFPSSLIINQMAKALTRENGELIVGAFCSKQFEKFSYLFNSSPKMKTEINKTETKDVGRIAHHLIIEQGQKELTLLQVSVLKKKRENYFLFLIMTLSRNSLTLEELKMYPKLLKSVKELTDALIITREENVIKTVSTEYRFPKSRDRSLEETYKLFDKWDFEFSDEFEFKQLINKMMIRRVSPRYLGVIHKQIEAFTDFVRCSDESDKHHNTDVLHLSIKISHGKIAG